MMDPFGPPASSHTDPKSRGRQSPRGWLRRWWLWHQPPRDTLRLTQRNIYVLPTKAGLMLGVTLLTLLLGTINYQLSLGYVLTFLLAGSAMVALFTGHANLRGLQMALRAPQDVFAQASTQVQIDLHNSSTRARYALAVRWYDEPHASMLDLNPGAQVSTTLRMSWPQRGEHTLPLIVMETRFPIGTFRCWSVWRPRATVLVYPSPEPQPPGLPRGAASLGAGETHHATDAAEFDGVRAYRTGDSLKQLLWKKYARAGELVSRDGHSRSDAFTWLDWELCGGLSPEARLSRLTAWVLEADRLGIRYGLRLPGREIPPATGLPHRMACLELLARW